MKLARTDRERVRATTFRANYIIRDISIKKTREKKSFKLRLEGRSRVGRTDEDKERVPQGAEAHEVGVAKGSGPRGKETKVETGRTTTRTRRGKLDKLDKLGDVKKNIAMEAPKKEEKIKVCEKKRKWQKP